MGVTVIEPPTMEYKFASRMTWEPIRGQILLSGFTPGPTAFYVNDQPVDVVVEPDGSGTLQFKKSDPEFHYFVRLVTPGDAQEQRIAIHY